MGRFLALALVLAGCGDNLPTDVVGPDNTVPGTEVGTEGTGTTAARVVPTVCGSSSWDSAITTTTMDLAVLGQKEGATLLTVPRDGGALSGFVLDTRMRMMAGEQKIDIKVPLSQISVSQLSGRIAATGIADGSMYLHVLDTDLSNPQFVTKMPANVIAKPALYQDVADDMVMPVGTDQGLAYYRFADSGEPLDTKLIVPSKPVRSMAVAQMGVSIFSAWSTDSECYMMQSATYSAGHTSYQTVACQNPSLAVNSATGEGMMAFESAEGVRVMFTNGQQFGGDAVLLRPETSAPRMLFDGQRFWISYLDTRGDVIVGFFDQNRHLTTMSLGGPKPYTSAYRMEMVEGSPWVFAFDDTGYTGNRMCLDVLQ